MGELAFTIDEYSALEHVYQLSKPGSATQQAWNIKVVTNSWGPGFPFDSIDANDLTVQIIEKLLLKIMLRSFLLMEMMVEREMKINLTFFAKVPAAIGVAASNRDGIGMSDFSSRGDMSDRDTWPDVTALGVDIWSAAACVYNDRCRNWCRRFRFWRIRLLLSCN